MPFIAATMNTGRGVAERGGGTGTGSVRDEDDEDLLASRTVMTCSEEVVAVTVWAAPGARVWIWICA